jgi:peptidoglycan/LPS O-acetylase OafA/YrhL
MKKKGKGYYLWLLVPLFFALVGGILAFLAVRDRDKEFAYICLGLGVFMSIVYAAVTIVEESGTHESYETYTTYSMWKVTG